MWCVSTWYTSPLPASFLLSLCVRTPTGFHIVGTVRLARARVLECSVGLHFMWHTPDRACASSAVWVFLQSEGCRDCVTVPYRYLETAPHFMIQGPGGCGRGRSAPVPACSPYREAVGLCHLHTPHPTTDNACNSRQWGLNRCKDFFKDCHHLLDG